MWKKTVRGELEEEGGEAVRERGSLLGIAQIEKLSGAGHGSWAWDWACSERPSAAQAEAGVGPHFPFL